MRGRIRIVGRKRCCRLISYREGGRDGGREGGYVMRFGLW